MKLVFFLKKSFQTFFEFFFTFFNFCNFSLSFISKIINYFCIFFSNFLLFLNFLNFSSFLNFSFWIFDHFFLKNFANLFLLFWFTHKWRSVVQSDSIIHCVHTVRARVNMCDTNPAFSERKTRVCMSRPIHTFKTFFNIFFYTFFFVNVSPKFCHFLLCKLSNLFQRFSFFLIFSFFFQKIVFTTFFDLADCEESFQKKKNKKRK